MYLKSIEIQGFKSFANKIVFQFHNGITGIVGPNGSGKSNVADAVRWVLGEQRVKQLRGGSMQDVIFAGTQNRKPMGYASVAITLDNSDKSLPIAYDEVTVTRRVYRSGESEYLINGTACRLKDINELFYDTGIGKEGYSIIGQGQIDRILSGKPEERRELFDEAAGIVKFKKRKLTAEKKLEDERGNLVRVNDILSEITKQLGPLKRQAETAKVYMKKKEELKIYDINMFLLDMERIRKEQSAVLEKLSNSESEITQNRQLFENIRQEYEKKESEIEQLEMQIGQQRDQGAKEELQKQQLENQIAIIQEQIHAFEAQQTHFRNRLQTIERDRTEKQEQILTEQQNLAALQEENKSGKEEAQEVMRQSAKMIEEIERLEASIEEGKQEIIAILNERATVKAKLQRFETMQEQQRLRKSELDSRQLSLRTSEDERHEMLQKMKDEMDTVSQKIQTMETQNQGWEEVLNQLNKELGTNSRKLEESQQKFHRENSRLESLRNITERYDGYGNSIRRVMEQKSKVSGIHGVVADLIHVEKKYETAIETALGGSIQNIVTEDEQTAKKLIQYLKQNKYGRATFLPLTSTGRSQSSVPKGALSESGVIGSADGLVQTEAQYQPLMTSLLGRTIVVDRIDTGISLEKKYHYSLRIVTLDGELLSPGGSMTGGAFKNSSNLLGRRREIEELETAVEKLKTDNQSLQKSIGEIRKGQTEYREKIAQSRDTLQSLYLKQNTFKVTISQESGKADENQSAYSKIKTEIKEIEHQIAVISREQDQIQEQLEISIFREKEIEVQNQKTAKETEAKKVSRQEQAALLEKSHLQISGMEQREEFLMQNINRLQEEQKILSGEKEQLLLQIGNDTDESSEKEKQIETIKEMIAVADSQSKSRKEELKKLLKEKETATKAQKGFFEKRESLSEHINLLDKEIFRLQSQKERLEDAEETLTTYMWDEYELTLNNAKSLRNEEMTDGKTLKKEIQLRKNEIKSLGNVNVNAIDDYKEMEERYTFLSTQHDDLVKSEKILLDIIKELDDGMRKQFQENFVIIQKEFDKAFKELFGGGKGSLEIMEDEDILTAGIRIIAQPPGKKLQNMMQMSGGEKALTAIALLFAIQNLRPSPFCLLDEIEAALDESNVNRYAGYLHKLTKNTQFIVITHRRGTMAAADRLYGITMQEKGISALVSVNFIEDDLDN